MTKQVHEGRAVAHLWAHGAQESARNHNGQVYFEGRILYSYGSHFPLGVRMGVNDAILNSADYSITTSKHKSFAAGAVSHMRTVHVDLKNRADIARTFARIADRLNENRKPTPEQVRDVLAFIASEAESLSRERQVYDRDAPDPRHGEPAEGGEQPSWMRGAYVGTGETYGETLAAMCGVPSVRARAALKRGKAAADKKAKREAAEAVKRDRDEAATVADMSANEFESRYLASRYGVRPIDGSYSDDSSAEGLKRASKGLFRLIRTAKAAKLSAKRQAALKAHRAAVQATLKAFETDRAELVAKLRAERFANWEARYRAAKTDAERLAVWRTNGVSANAYGEGTPEREALQAADAEGRRLNDADRMAQEAAKRAEWLAGGARHVHLSGPDGTALVRRSPDGERLETSHGADVPWDHAVKAFRFIALCVAKGEAWERNGRQVRVGHYQLDRIEPNGDMRAGCHRFAWAAMRELAEREGVLTLAPSDEAVTVTH